MTSPSDADPSPSSRSRCSWLGNANWIAKLAIQLDDGDWSSQDDVFLDDDDCSCRDVAYLDYVGVESTLLTK